MAIMFHVKVGGLKSSQIKRIVRDHQAWRLPKSWLLSSDPHVFGAGQLCDMSHSPLCPVAPVETG